MSTPTAPTLALLSRAKPPWVEITQVAQHRLGVTATLALKSGRVSEYELGIEAGPPVRVREVGHSRLPTFCPERHINGGGYFCLGYNQRELIAPFTVDEASVWWATLHGFLKLQEIASRTARWDAEAWPHGEPAVRIALEISMRANQLPAEVVSAVRAGETVRLAQRRVTHRRRPCVCGSGRPTRACHEKSMVELARLDQMLREAEAAFWKPFRGSHCCGTMKTCPLLRRAKSAKQG